MVVFTFVFVKKDEVCNCSNHIREPEKIGYDEIFTEWNHVIENSMHNMVTVNGHPFQIKKQYKVNTAVGKYNKAMPVFFAKF